MKKRSLLWGSLILILFLSACQTETTTTSNQSQQPTTGKTSTTTPTTNPSSETSTNNVSTYGSGKSQPISQKVLEDTFQLEFSTAFAPIDELIFGKDQYSSTAQIAHWDNLSIKDVNSDEITVSTKGMQEIIFTKKDNSGITDIDQLVVSEAQSFENLTSSNLKSPYFIRYDIDLFPGKRPEDTLKDVKIDQQVIEDVASLFLPDSTQEIMNTLETLDSNEHLSKYVELWNDRNASMEVYLNEYGNVIKIKLTRYLE